MGILHAIDWLGWIKWCVENLLRFEKKELCISQKYVTKKDQGGNGLKSFT